MHSERKRSLAVCCGVHALQDGLSATLYVLLPVLAQAFGLGYAQVGIIRAANNAAMGALEMPSGLLAERMGERTLLVFGLLCAGMGYMALAASGTFALILISLLLAGIGGAFQHALSSSVITGAFPGAGRRAALGVYNSSGDVGKLAFTGLFSLAAGMGAAWQTTTAGFGVLAVLGAAAALWGLRHLEAGRRSRREAHPPAVRGGSDWGILHRRGFAALVAVVFLDIAVQSGFLTFLGLLMIEKRVPASLAALAVVLTLAGGTFGKLGCGLLAERVGVMRSLVMVQCLTALGIVAVIAAPAVLAYVLLPLLGVVLQGSSSITYGAVSDLMRSDRQSRGFAAVYTVSSAASVLGPIGFGALGDGLGLLLALAAMALTVLVTLPLSLPLSAALGGGPAQPAGPP